MSRHNPTPPGTGSKTIHLRDIPIHQRLLAVSYLARRELIKTEGERATLLALAIDPGDKGGRIT